MPIRFVLTEKLYYMKSYIKILHQLCKTFTVVALFANFFVFSAFAQPVSDDPQTIIIRDNHVHRLYVENPHRQHTEPQQRNGYKVLAGISIGTNYIYSPSLKFKDGGVTTNLIAEGGAHTILPINLELETPQINKVSFSVGGSYILNPFWNSKTISNNGVIVFNAKTKYSMYGKLNYNFSHKFSGYILGGATNFELFVYNDITNNLFVTANTTAPSAGIGFTLATSPNARIFTDFIYSYLKDAAPQYTGTNKRLDAISKREYHSFQAKIGFVMNFTIN